MAVGTKKTDTLKYYVPNDLNKADIRENETEN